MLRHNDKSNQAKALGLTCAVKLIRQNAPPCFVCQQRLTTITGRRQLMQMTVALEVSHMFPMSCHRGSVTKGTGKGSVAHKASSQQCYPSGTDLIAASSIDEK